MDKELRLRRMPIDLYKKVLLAQGIESARKGRAVNIDQTIFKIIREYKIKDNKKPSPAGERS